MKISKYLLKVFINERNYCRKNLQKYIVSDTNLNHAHDVVSVSENSTNTEDLELQYFIYKKW